MTLFIIGNGFDLNEGLNTRYSDFKKYLENHNSKLLDDLMFFYKNIFDLDVDEDSVMNFDKSIFISSKGKSFIPNDLNLWSSFEKNMANISFSNIRDIVGFGKFPLKNYDETLTTLKRYFETTLQNLKISLKQWIKSINIYPTLFINKFPKDCEFINFNYTDTLEQKYLVRSDKICYLHNNKKDNEIVFGCCVYDIKNFKSYQFDHVSENDMAKQLRKILCENVKKTEDIIELKLKPFLANKRFENIIVLGSSLSNVDLPYFEWINSKNPKAKWMISYHSHNDLYNIKNQLELINVQSYSLYNNIDTILEKL